MNNDTCPKCQFPKMSASALECPRCGIVFARYRGYSAVQPAISPTLPEEARPSPSTVNNNDPFDWIDGKPLEGFEGPPQHVRSPSPKPTEPSHEWFAEPPPTSLDEPILDMTSTPQSLLVSRHGSAGGNWLGPLEGYLSTEPGSGIKSVWLAVGLVMAGFITFSDWPRWILGILSVLIHELGHAAFAWAFGRPAIPSLDLVYGGGVTPTFDQSWLLVLVIAALLYLPFAKHRHVLAVNIRAGIFIGVYLGAAFSPVSEVLWIAGGHGLVMISIVYCLYLVMRGTGFKTPLDAPLYATIGFFNLFHLLGEYWQLATSSDFRADYEQAKGGHPSDFSFLAEMFGLSTAPLAWLAMVAALTTPLLAYLLFKHNTVWRDWLADRYARLTSETE